MSGMEAMLLGGDSSDDDSDNEKAQAPIAVAPIAAPVAAPPPPDVSQADVSKRLRDLYSPAAAAAANKGAPTSQPVPQQQSPPPTQPIQQQPHPSMVQRPPPPPQQAQRYISTGNNSTATSASARGSMPPAQQTTAGPFAPTPVPKIMDRHVPNQRARSGSIPNAPVAHQVPPAHLQQQQTTQHHHRQATNVAVSSVPSASLARQGSSVPAQQMTEEQIRRKQQEKDNFINFTKVLLKYLEQKDPNVYHQVKAVIKDCADKNKRREPGYESVTSSMHTRLREVVSEAHWKRAQAYFAHFLRQKKAQQANSGAPVPSSSSQPSPAAVATTAPPSAVADPTQSSATSAATATSNTEMERQKREKLMQLQLQKQRQAQAAASKTSTSQQQIPTETPPPAPLPEQGTPSTGSTATKASSVATAKTAATAGTTTGASGGKSKGGAKTNRKQQQAQTAASTKPQPALQRKGSTSSVAASTKEPAKGSTVTAPAPAPPVVTPAPDTIPPEVVKEYNEYMELVDHAMNLDDWTSTSLILGQKTLATLSDEQEQLLYGGAKPDPPSAEPQGESFFPSPGWSKRNVISSRTGWAKVRLRERAYVKSLHEQQKKNGQQLTPIAPFITLPPPLPERTVAVTSWFNEDVAEEDKALAAISEATQIFLKDVLQKALYCARQRENVDGIRLWHQQVTNRPSGDKKSPLSLRLGCNVRRQLAQSQGNAAMTVKRMEEALERQTDFPTQSRSLDDRTLLQLNSMEDASLRPRLGKAVDSADLDAKRSYEIFGGKNEESEPPLGRLSKQPRLQVVDFQMGMNMLTPSSYGSGRHRATAMGAGFSF